MTGLTKRGEQEVLYERKGNVADKNGRTMKRPWARQALLVALSAETLDGSGRKTKKLRIIIDRLVNAAMSGEPWAIKEVLDRVDGKATQLLGSDPDNPLPEGQSVGTLIVEYVKAGEYDGVKPFAPPPEDVKEAAAAE